MSADGPARCPHFHQAVELVGRRWSGAILQVLLVHEPLRFTELRTAVPDLSDRLLSERVKELEDRGLVERRERAPRGVEYALTDMGRELEPAVAALQQWGRRWLAD